MRSFAAALLVGLVLIASGPQAIVPVAAGVNGGTDCAVCTLVLALTKQTMELRNSTAQQAIDTMCTFLPDNFLDVACEVAVIPFLGTIVPLLEAGETPDVMCNALKMCNNESGQTCHLFPRPPGLDSEELFSAHVHRVQLQHGYRGAKFDICKLVPGVCEVEKHRPFFDTDNDFFSTYPSLRGSYWRGKDCDDLDASVFPGRDTSDAVADSNCNGIVGIDANSSQTYEEMWCKDTGAMGIASLGDSATAHFRLPPTYVTARGLNKDTYKHIVRLLENEADWPMLSWSTGHLNASGFEPDISGPVSSLYTRMRERNLCNHRDYQNIGVNGARVGRLDNFEQDLNRNVSKGLSLKPLLLVMSMIGNDVCNGHHDFHSMTPVAQYYESVYSAVMRADKFLPKGSKILLVALVDGRILYDTMHDRIHPIGSTHNDVTYTMLYDYLNCLRVSPCWGWMNSNATVRNMTTAHAMLLDQQLPKVVAATKGKLQNVKVFYLGNLLDRALNEYPGPKYELIEPVDGFHPSQMANALIGDYIFNQTLLHGVQGPVNPNNELIKAKFGDQGGY